MKINALASDVHFVEHLEPIFKALPEEIRGTFYTVRKASAKRAKELGISPQDLRKKDVDPMMVASIGDVRRAGPRARPVILVEHGVGLSFTDMPYHPSYPGGASIRKFVSLILSTNQQAADKDRSVVAPGRDVEVIGAPKLDRFFGIDFPRNDPPIIGFATHWDCHTCPETRSAFPYYKEALRRLAKDYVVIGHAHPRWRGTIYGKYKKLGMGTERRWPNIISTCDLLIGDVGSAPYEFAYTGKPVVVLNCKLYRRHVNHGLRFWDYIPGIQCDDPVGLETCVKIALEYPEHLRELSRRAVEYVYPYRGEATKRAVEVILRWIEKKGERNDSPTVWR